MSFAQRMIQTSPSQPQVDQNTLVECIRACFDCAQACTACADACLGEHNLAELRRCIRLNLDCADLCEATGRIVSRQTAFDAETARAALRACATACRVCGDECDRHAQHGMGHCAVCAEACRRCAQACDALAAQLAA